MKEHGVKESSIILSNLFCTPQAAKTVVAAFPDMKILTSELHPVAPNHFGQRYFGTDWNITAFHIVFLPSKVKPFIHCSVFKLPLTLYVDTDNFDYHFAAKFILSLFNKLRKRYIYSNIYHLNFLLLLRRMPFQSNWCLW